MAELALAIVSSVTAGIDTWAKIDKALNSIKNAPTYIEDLRLQGPVLVTSLAMMRDKIKTRPNNLTSTEQDFYKAIIGFTNRFEDNLKELENILLTQERGKKSWYYFKLQRKVDRQLKESLSRNIEMFHLSASFLSILATPSTSASGLVVPVDELTRFIESISDDNPKQLDEGEQSDVDKLKTALREVAYVTFRQTLSSSATDKTTSPVLPNIPSNNEVPRRYLGVIRNKELGDRFRNAISLTKRMYNEAPPAFANRAYEEAMQHRKMMQSADADAIEDPVELEILHIRIINACVPSDKSYKSLQDEQLTKLRDSLLKENPELRDKQEKVGILCASLHDYDGAIDLLRLSLDTYLPDPHLSNTYLPDHDPNKDKIKQISMLVAEQYERSNQSIELLAFKEALLDSLTYDPTSEPNAVNNTIEWCRQHKFQAMKRDECLYIPEYLANGTLLHRAAADMHIQPEVIH
ncbi:hypothetical protein FPSE_04460 [Fusarium pseudograminearum CS3096]|uniref:Fungal N-terminal domain-containing protein n=1 Tax=Fusarium pseudograminearum (strain CS3096) TaxID=1028729 RepID=K3VLC7_FUSPC|nr:hypothetical protein FPSE_04460 [Fusarium pseudograminearum CS3096]EKJ75379.1 hypothetical protein FPSE_04460 [Fusarium pseudograminearum CS3096]